MAEFWAFVLGLALILYVLLDGFDLGVGILFAFAPGSRARRHMMEAISPVWDGNETWLVISGGTLFGAFPAAYAILVGAYYLPVIVMLCGLILRGVAFEFREKASPNVRWIWSTSFAAGSIVAAFAQGAAIGSFVQELPVHDGKFAGSVMTWLSPYAVWCGFGLVLGYALLGACWLVNKTFKDVRDFGYRMMPKIFVGLAIFLVGAVIWIFAMHLRIASQWFERPYLFAFLGVGLIAAALLVWGWYKQIDRLPLPAAMVMFVAAFATMVFAVLPYIVPFSLTIQQAAAPHSSLAFLFWGAGIIILPITLIYTAVVYWIFRGRVVHSDEDDDDYGPDAGSTAPSRKPRDDGGRPGLVTAFEKALSGTSASHRDAADDDGWSPYDAVHSGHGRGAEPASHGDRDGLLGGLGRRLSSRVGISVTVIGAALAFAAWRDYRRRNRLRPRELSTVAGEDA